jgi:hypothetical protein
MKFQKYVSSALASVVKRAKSRKLAKEFCVKSVRVFFFDIGNGF